MQSWSGTAETQLPLVSPALTHHLYPGWDLLAVGQCSHYESWSRRGAGRCLSCLRANGKEWQESATDKATLGDVHQQIIPHILPLPRAPLPLLDVRQRSTSTTLSLPFRHIALLAAPRPDLWTNLFLFLSLFAHTDRRSPAAQARCPLAAVSCSVGSVDPV